MKRLYLLLLLTHLALCGFSQWNLSVSSRVEKDGKGLSGATINLMQAGKLIKTQQSDGEGYFSMDVPPNGDYMIEVSYPNCNVKKFQVLTRGVPAEVADEGFMPSYKIGGFTMKPPLPGIDYSALRNPVVKILFITRIGKFDHEDAHTEMMLGELGKIRDAEEALIKKQQDFTKAGDQALKKGDCAGAKINYESAVKTIPVAPYQDYSVAQLAKCNSCLAEKENAAKQEAEKAAAEKAAAAKKAEDERLAKEKAEKEKRDAELKKDEEKKLAAKKAEEDKLAKEKAEKDAAAAAEAKKAEEKKLADKKAEEERLAKEKADKDKRDADQKKEEEKKLAARKAEEDKLAKEKAEKDAAAAASARKAEEKKLADKKSEEDRLAKEKAAKDNAAAEARKTEEKKLADKKAEDERIAREKAEKDRLALEDKKKADASAADKKKTEEAAARKAESDRSAKEKAEKDRKDAEAKLAAQKKAEAEKASKDKQVATSTPKKDPPVVREPEKPKEPAKAADPQQVANNGVQNKAEPVTQKKDIGSSKAKYSIPRVLGMDPYKAAISKGDELFKDKRYSEAREAYESALSVRADDPYAKGKIEQINKLSPVK